MAAPLYQSTAVASIRGAGQGFSKNQKKAKVSEAKLPSPRNGRRAGDEGRLVPALTLNPLLVPGEESQAPLLSSKKGIDNGGR